MPQPTQTKIQLPVAPDAAALSNRISMALASKASVLKTMNPSPSAGASRPQRRRAAANDDDDNDEDMRRGARLNEGIGYIAEAEAGKTKSDVAREDQILRSRLLGKRRAGAASGATARDDSESDEDVGRSALGKRKRPRRADVSTAPEAQGDQTVGANEADKDKAPAAEQLVTHVKTEVEGDAKVTNAGAMTANSDRPKKKKKKNKKKNKPGNGNDAEQP